MLPAKTNDLLDQLIIEMAMVLAFGRIDLHDERQVLRALVAAGFAEGDILGLSPQVIATARAKSTKPGETK